MDDTGENLESAERFAETYMRVETETMRKIETAVCGCDYGGTSWTTLIEANELGHLLDLTPETHLLEIGCGSGWPALYLAQVSGCQATLTDVSAVGLEVATRRAKADGLTERCRFHKAGGDSLPFDDGAFDAIGHSDVLCCLEPKMDVLRECRRVIKEGGVMGFSVIHMREGASAAETERVAAFGPSLIGAPLSYPEMLKQTGWQITHQADITEEFAETVRRRTEMFQSLAGELRDMLGAAEYEDELARLQGRQDVIGEGLAKRTLFAVKAV